MKRLKTPGSFSATRQPLTRGRGPTGFGALVKVAQHRIFAARLIGWKALEDSWQGTLDQLLKAKA